MGQLTKAHRKIIIRQPGHGPKNEETRVCLLIQSQ